MPAIIINIISHSFHHVEKEKYTGTRPPRQKTLDAPCTFISPLQNIYHFHFHLPSKSITFTSPQNLSLSLSPPLKIYYFHFHLPQNLSPKCYFAFQQLNTFDVNSETSIWQSRFNLDSMNIRDDSSPFSSRWWFPPKRTSYAVDLVVHYFLFPSPQSAPSKTLIYRQPHSTTLGSPNFS